MATKLELEEYLYRRAIDIIESADSDPDKERLLFQEVWIPLIPEMLKSQTAWIDFVTLLGRLEDLPITDILQIVYLSRRTGILEVVQPDRRSQIRCWRDFSRWSMLQPDPPCGREPV